MEIEEIVEKVNEYYENNNSETRYWIQYSDKCGVMFFICYNALSEQDEIYEVSEEKVRKDYDKIVLHQLTDLRSRAFDMANSGKHGVYPYDETFNEEVELGFNDNGTEWEAKDGTVLTI